MKPLFPTPLQIVDLRRLRRGRKRRSFGSLSISLRVREAMPEAVLKATPEGKTFGCAFSKGKSDAFTPLWGTNLRLTKGGTTCVTARVKPINKKKINNKWWI